MSWTPDYRLRWRLPDGSVREASAYGRINVLAHAEMEEIALPQACGGQAECGTCRVRVISGELTAVRGEEHELMTRHAKRFRDGERLACQARPRSDLEIEVLAMMPEDLRDVDQ